MFTVQQALNHVPVVTITPHPMEKINCSHLKNPLCNSNHNHGYKSHKWSEASPNLNLSGTAPHQRWSQEAVRIKELIMMLCSGRLDCWSFMCGHFSTQHRDCASNFHHSEHRLGFETNALLVRICPGRCVSLLVAQCRFGNWRSKFFGDCE